MKLAPYIHEMKNYYVMSLITLLLLSLARACAAQETNNTVFILLGIFTPIALIGIIVCVCIYSYYRYFHSSTSTRQTQRPQYVHGNQRSNTSIVYPQYQSRSNRQPYSSRTTTPPSTNLNFPPIGSGPIARTSQTVPQASEPVFLPKATLHHGDAPPAYEEAIKMKAVITMNEPNS